MSEENTSQATTEDVVTDTNDTPNIGGDVKDEGSTSEGKTDAELLYGNNKDKESDDKGDDDPDSDDSDKGKKDGEGDGKDKDDKGDEGDDKEDYDSLDKPDNSLLSDADLKRILSESKEEGLSKEAAQKRVNHASEILQNHSNNLNQTHKEMVQQWAEDCKSDKEIGGDNYNESVELARRVVSRFGTNEFKKVLNDTGAGNHSEFVRIFSRIGKVMGDDTLILPGKDSGDEKSMASIFYGENKKED